MPAKLQALLAGTLPPQLRSSRPAGETVAEFVDRVNPGLRASLPPATLTRAQVQALIPPVTSVAQFKQLAAATKKLPGKSTVRFPISRIPIPFETVNPGITTTTKKKNPFVPPGTRLPLPPNDTTLPPIDTIDTTRNPRMPLNNPIGNPLFPATGGASIPAFPSGSAGTGGIGSLCGLLPAGWQRSICEAGVNIIPGLSNRQSDGQVLPCPSGYEPDGKGGCRIKGFDLPGIDVGMQDTGWTPVAGRYGVGATPIAVARTTRACPPGFVLGKDGVCYDHLPRTARAHNPGTKPLLTGGDVSALRRARTLEKKISKLARVHGKKTCHCHSTGKRKK